MQNSRAQPAEAKTRSEEEEEQEQGEQQQPPPLLEVSRISVSYGDLQVLWNVSFEVPERSIVSLVGSNGAGKTTTLKTVVGMVRPTSGSIVYDGREITRLSTARIVDSGVIYIPEGRGIFPEMSVRENLDLGSYTRHARRYHDKMLERVFSLFPILSERKTQKAGTLSGGESQMLAIARGLMQIPRVLMLDEPSAGIAPIVVDSIFHSIERLRDEDGITILLIEQDAGRALQISDYAYVLENGRMTLSGRGPELLDNEHVREAYLGM